MTRPRRICGLFVRITMWTLGIGCVALLLAVGIAPRTGRYRTLTVLSASMSPGIPPEVWWW